MKRFLMCGLLRETSLGGLLQEKDRKKHLKELKDASDNAEFVPIDEEENRRENVRR